MIRYKVDFDTLEWESPFEGVRHKCLEQNGFCSRLVEYSKEMPPHWCEKGHLVYCLEGSVVNELKEGSESVLKPGMSYIVSDTLSSHRSVTKEGVKLLIVDGDFLKLKEEE